MKIKKSDLEACRQTSEMAPDARPSMKDLPHQALMALPEANKEPEAIQDGKAPPPLNSTVGEAKDLLDKFLESLHKKASTATSWINQLEKDGTDQSPKQKQPPGLSKENSKTTQNNQKPRWFLIVLFLGELRIFNPCSAKPLPTHTAK